MCKCVRGWRLPLLCGTAIATFASLAPAEEPEAGRPVIASREPGSSYFGGDDVALHFTVVVQQNRSRPGHSGAFSVDQHVVARGEAPLSPRQGRAAEFTLKFKTPDVKEGVVLAGQVSIVVTSKTRPERKARLDRPLWLFPRDPFAGRTIWLRDRKIVLFDPPGRTAKISQGRWPPVHRAEQPRCGRRGLRGHIGHR